MSDEIYPDQKAEPCLDGSIDFEIIRPVRRNLKFAVACGVTVAVFASMAIVAEVSNSTPKSHANSASASQPTAESDVPAVIPAQGVAVGSWVLTPSNVLSNSSSSIVSKSKSNVSTANLITGVEAVIKATGWSASIVAALMGKIQITPVDFSIPGITHYSGGNVTNNPSVWIVTLPITPMQNPLTAVGDHPGMPAGFKVPMVSHVNYAVDAATGAVLSQLWTP